MSKRLNLVGEEEKQRNSQLSSEKLVYFEFNS